MVPGYGKRIARVVESPSALKSQVQFYARPEYGEQLVHVLQLLQMEEGQIVLHETFCGVIWNDNVNIYSMSSLWNAIYRLRKKGHCIGTVRGLGYRLE